MQQLPHLSPQDLHLSHPVPTAASGRAEDSRRAEQTLQEKVQQLLQTADVVDPFTETVSATLRRISQDKAQHEPDPAAMDDPEGQSTQRFLRFWSLLGM